MMLREIRNAKRIHSGQENGRGVRYQTSLPEYINDYPLLLQAGKGYIGLASEYFSGNTNLIC